MTGTKANGVENSAQSHPSHLLFQGRFADLEKHLPPGADADSPRRDPHDPEHGDATTAYLLGAMAILERRPFLDAMEAAYTLTASDHPAAAAMTARAIAMLGSAGAIGLARQKLEEAKTTWPEDPAIELCSDQMDAGRFHGHTRLQWEWLQALDKGKVTEVRKTLEAFVSQPAPTWSDDQRNPEDLTLLLDRETRQWAHRKLADLWRLERNFARAADHLQACLDMAPQADDAPTFDLAVALARWAGNDRDVALERLRRLRELPPDSGLQRYVRNTSETILAALDRDPEAISLGPRWHDISARPTAVSTQKTPGPGLGMWLLLQDALGLQSPPAAGDLSSMAALRHLLSAQEVVSIRLMIEEERLGDLLDQDVLVVLEEERATETGFLLVAGYESTARLLLLQDPLRPGAYLRDTTSQWGQSSLFGNSALVVCGRGEQGERTKDRLEKLGFRPHPGLEALDLCEMDERGQIVPRARKAALADQAADLAPDLPQVVLQKGMALLDILRTSGDFTGEFERWYAKTRRRFPDSEWPFQIYAQGLEHRGLVEEAGIAWSDAAQRDAWDYRNFLGMARVRLRLGDLDKTEQWARRAIELKPDSASAINLLSQVAMQRHDWNEADLLTQIATELSPENPDPLMNRATVLEQREEFSAALATLEQLVETTPDVMDAHIRILRRLWHDARWKDAQAAAELLCDQWPADGFAWARASDILLTQGKLDEAFEKGLAGIQRCGPSPDLIRSAVSALAYQGDEAFGRSLERLVGLLVGQWRALADVSSDLETFSHLEASKKVGHFIIEQAPDDPNGPWRLAQTLLRGLSDHPEDREETEALLRRTVEATGNYALARVALGTLLLEDDPRAALDLAEGADLSAAPALVWHLMAQALQGLDRPGEASTLLSRLADLPEDAVLEVADFLFNTGFDKAGIDLLDALELSSSGPGLLKKARALARMKQWQQAADLLLPLDESDDMAIETATSRVWILEHLGQWDRLETESRLLIRKLLKQSASSFRDIWPFQGVLAGASLARGDRKERELLLEKAPRHPTALSALVRIERALSHPLADQDARSLLELAPGALRFLERGGAM